MTRIFGSMVMRNESDRYLAAVVTHMRPFLDSLFVWDDQSDDGSPGVARKAGADCVVIRDDDTPSFIEHEGQFRHAAWTAFEENMQPNEGDWILSFDTDEFLVGVLPDFSDVRILLEHVIEVATKDGLVGVVLPFPEIFEIIEGIPHFRTDGLWNTIKGPRLFRYQKDATWSDKAMGCGSEPQYVANGKVLRTASGLRMLHFGYANPAEHVTKWRRYTELYDHGHSNAHIQSIIAQPTLEPWNGPIPNWSLDV